jgi:hypothetical protein
MHPVSPAPSEITFKAGYFGRPHLAKNVGFERRPELPVYPQLRAFSPNNAYFPAPMS